jgi:hypothetical protein
MRLVQVDGNRSEQLSCMPFQRRRHYKPNLEPNSSQRPLDRRLTRYKYIHFDHHTCTHYSIPAPACSHSCSLFLSFSFLDSCTHIIGHRRNRRCYTFLVLGRLTYEYLLISFLPLLLTGAFKVHSCNVACDRVYSTLMVSFAKLLCRLLSVICDV